MFSKLRKSNYSQQLLIILIAGFIIRMILTNVTYSHDAAGFVLWSRYLTEHKFVDVFEFLPGGYPPYPPAYYYILKSIGHFISVFNIWDYEWLVYLLIKLPVYISDIVVTSLVYTLAKQWFSSRAAIMSTVFYIFNPAIIYTTTLLGQIDSVLIALGITTFYLLFKKRIVLGSIIFLLAVLTKPQAIAILPLVVVYLYKTTNIKKLILLLATNALLALLFFLPILTEKGLGWTLSYFAALPHWYPYTSVYAYSIWAVLGFMIPDSITFIGIPVRFWGLFIFATLTIIILLPLIKNKKPKPVIFSAYLLFFAFALFSTRIHSRYLIYSLGFFAPFFTRFPKFGIFLSLLIFANLLLPEKNPALSSVVFLMTTKSMIYVFVIIAFILFIVSFKVYLTLVRSINESKI